MNNDLEVLDSLLGSVDPAVTGAVLASMGFMIVIVGIILLPIAILTIIAHWKIFTKAGKPGWAAIIPIYNVWVMLEIVGLPGWISLVVLLGFIPQLTGLVAVAQFVLNIFIAIKLAPLFKKEQSFAIGLILVPFVFYPILAFGKNEYTGISTKVTEPVVEAEPIVETKTDIEE